MCHSHIKPPRPHPPDLPHYHHQTIFRRSYFLGNCTRPSPSHLPVPQIGFEISQHSLATKVDNSNTGAASKQPTTTTNSESVSSNGDRRHNTRLPAYIITGRPFPAAQNQENYRGHTIPQTQTQVPGSKGRHARRTPSVGRQSHATPS